MSIVFSALEGLGKTSHENLRLNKCLFRIFSKYKHLNKPKTIEPNFKKEK